MPSNKFFAIDSQVFHLTAQTISMGVDVLAVRDFADQSVVHVFDLLPGASRQEDGKSKP